MQLPPEIANYLTQERRISLETARKLRVTAQQTKTHLNPPETHLNPPCEGGLENSADNEVRSIQAPSLTGRDGVGLRVGLGVGLGRERGASPFEDPPGPNGERSYHGGRPLPPDAPPRPSPQAEWDEAEGKWWEGWTLPPGSES